ncbi:PH domain-like protein [Ascodesmis nigricans]|uniref:PH domain-like protein n=1 Tax=Ascodesmis nigricans TaxID=341454 RepID=A0A4S2MV68_9PEZI|nr:PH domain-like protein [Ascodesmis nigricans]
MSGQQQLLPQSLQIQIKPAVDPQGTFVQDKVLKSGWLEKRTRKTKSWKRRWFVLRGDRLSCYKDETEYKIHRQIILADITAVAQLKDAKSRFVFGIFSPSRNFRFRGTSEAEVDDWVGKIRSAASLEETEEEFLLNSPTSAPEQGHQFPSPEHRVGSSSSEVARSPFGTAVRGIGGGRMSSQTLEYSGPEFGGSVSSFGISQLSLAHHDPGVTSGAETADPRTSMEPTKKVVRNDSGLSMHDQTPREIWHGFLYCLKSKGGVKQWKRYWVVVKNINITFYKNQKEYRAIKILPIDTIVDAFEIDPLSKSRKHCLQIITEGKVFRFSAMNEDDLVNALGAMKSVLSKLKRRASVSVGHASAHPPAGNPQIVTPERPSMSAPPSQPQPQLVRPQS